jgi:type I restriction enzyme S subunit
MSLLDADLGASRSWTRVGDWYEVTRKPRRLDLTRFPAIPFAPMEAIPQGGAYAPAFTMRAPSAISSGTYFERGDLLISKITPSFENGKQALIYDLPLSFGYATTEVIPLRPRNKDHDPRLLFFYLLHPDVRHHVAERMEGSTGRQRVPESVLLDLPLPLLEPSDQKSIADSLEVLQHASSAELEAQRASHDLKRTAMHALFTRGLRGEAPKETEIGLIPQSWLPTPVAQLGAVKGGKRMPKGVSLVHQDTGRPYIRVTDFKDHSVRDEGILFVPRGYEDAIRRYRISSHDVYISIAGTIGLVGQVPPRLDDANLTENAAKIVFQRRDVLPRYVMHALAGNACQDQISRATAKNAQPKLALTRIEQILVPFPGSFEEQVEIAEALDAIDRKIDLHRRKHAVLDSLFKALLHKLMTGEIQVDQLDLSALSSVAPKEAAA